MSVAEVHDAASGAIEQAVRAACHADVAAPKPGNVSLGSPGHGMTGRDFVRSADAMAPALTASGLTVGQRIRAAVAATQDAVGTNTNLGIVLLAAPLVHVTQTPGAGPLRVRLGEILSALDVNDAVEAYAAIRQAAPGGLGQAARHDVAAPPTVTLYEAMAEAAGHDRIARQYVTVYADVFDLALPRLRAMRAQWNSDAWGVVSAYLAVLARWPDSHVMRKHGWSVARAVSDEARDLDRALVQAPAPAAVEGRIAATDRAWKARGVNPGTSADLVVAAVLADALEGLEADA